MSGSGSCGEGGGRCVWCRPLSPRPLWRPHSGAMPMVSKRALQHNGHNNLHQFAAAAKWVRISSTISMFPEHSSALAPEIATITASLNLVPQECRIDVLLFVNKLIAKHNVFAGTNTRRQLLMTHMQLLLVSLQGIELHATARQRYRATSIKSNLRMCLCQVLSYPQRAQHSDPLIYIHHTTHHRHNPLHPQQLPASNQDRADQAHRQQVHQWNLRRSLEHRQKATTLPTNTAILGIEKHRPRLLLHTKTSRKTTQVLHPSNLGSGFWFARNQTFLIIQLANHV